MSNDGLFYTPDPQDEDLNNESFSMHKPHTFAGLTVVNETSYEILRSLIAKNPDSSVISDIIAPEVEILSWLGKDISSLIEKGVPILADLQQQFDSPFPELVIESFKKSSEKFFNIMSKFEQSFEKDTQYDFNLSEEENDESSSFSANYRFFLAVLKYKLSFFITQANKEYCTDIAGAINSLQPIPEELKDNWEKRLADQIGKILENFDQQYNETEEDLENDIFSTEEYKKSYTSLPPHILRSLIVMLDEIRVDFICEAQTGSIKKDSIIQVLKDENNFKDSPLDFASELDHIKIEQDGHDIILTWDTPVLLAPSIVDNKEKLDEMLKPVKEFLQEVGGDLTSSTDRFEIRMTISCPVADEPESSFSDTLLGDEMIFNLSSNCASVVPTAARIKLRVESDPEDESKSFALFVGKNCIGDAKGRDSIINLLESLDQFNTNHSAAEVRIEKVQGLEDVLVSEIMYDSTTINGGYDPDCENRACLVFHPNILTDPKIVSSILTLINSRDCEMIELSSINSNETNLKILEALQCAIYKGLRVTESRLSISLEAPSKDEQELTVFDSKQNLIVNGIFLESTGRFCGRCHTPDLTRRVLGICDEIVGFDGQNATKIKLLGTKDDFVKNFEKELRERQVYPTRNFLSLITNVVKNVEELKSPSESYNDLPPVFQRAVEEINHISYDDVYLLLREEIAEGMVWIKEGFDIIGIDSPDSTSESTYTQSLKDKVIE